MKKIIYSFVIICGLFAASCGDNEVTTPATPAPVADFAFEIDGRTITFTDSSTDAISHEWDFGDGNTSTEASGSHTYADNGSYIAKLSVTNESGTDSRQVVLEMTNATIDGSFDDWDGVDDSILNTSGTITRVKFESLENNKLFIYVEGTEDLSPLTQILLNTDNDNTTGAFIDWFYFQAGEEIIIEGLLTAGEDQNGGIYECNPCDGSTPGTWNFEVEPVNAEISSFIEASEIVSIPGGKAYELAIDLTALGTPIAADAIGIAIIDLDASMWLPVGAAPIFLNAMEDPEATMFTYDFN